MQAVFKYPLASVGMNEVMLPLGAQVLSVGFQTPVQGQELFLWALVFEQREPLHARRFYVAETGAEMPMVATKLVGRAEFLVGRFPYVVHVFEVMS